MPAGANASQCSAGGGQDLPWASFYLRLTTKIQLLRESYSSRTPFTELASDMPSPAEPVEIRFTIELQPLAPSFVISSIIMLFANFALNDQTIGWER